MARNISELAARFVGSGGPGVYESDGVTPAKQRNGVGVIMNCPCGCADGLYVSFENPLDGGGPIATHAPLWHRTGDTLETLTLTPSVQRVGGCGWHGFITNGEAREC